MSKIAGRRVAGSVTEYVHDKGYGFFITLELEHNQEVFFHISELDVNRPQLGWRFEFTIENTDKGYQAIDAEKLEESTHSGSTTSKHGPGVTNDAGEDSADQYALERQQNKAAPDEDDDDDDVTDPFSDDVRGSKNDLL